MNKNDPFFTVNVKFLIKFQRTKRQSNNFNWQVSENALDDERIVGGIEAERHAYPWTVRLGVLIYHPLYQRGICDGTIICPKFVMTAWHCTGKTNPPKLRPADQIRVLVGGHNQSGFPYYDLPEGKIHKVLKIHRHPKGVVDEVHQVWDYDFALLELKEPIQFEKGARPVFLPSASDIESMKPNTKLAVTGWGRTQTQLDWYCLGPCILRVASLKYTPGRNCVQHYKPGSQICAGDWDPPPTGKTSCKGDSGG